MKSSNRLRKSYMELVIYGLSIIIGLVVYICIDRKPEWPIAVIATGISIAFGLRQYKIENDKMFKDLFTAFNQKYDEKFNDSLNEIDANTKKDPNYRLDKKNETKLVVDYLNLCAEEYLWFTKGRIDETVWLAWENGMKYYLNIASINAFIKEEKEQKDSYYGLFERLKL